VCFIPNEIRKTIKHSLKSSTKYINLPTNDIVIKILLKTDLYLYPPIWPDLGPTHLIILDIEGRLPVVKQPETARSLEFSA